MKDEGIIAVVPPNMAGGMGLWPDILQGDWSLAEA